MLVKVHFVNLVILNIFWINQSETACTKHSYKVRKTTQKPTISTTSATDSTAAISTTTTTIATSTTTTTNIITTYTTMTTITTTLEPCLVGWTRIEDSCFYYKKSLFTNSQADTFCKSYNATLAIIQSITKYQNAAASFCATPGTSCEVYIGAKAIIPLDFIWNDGTILARNSTWWKTLEPNNGGNNDTLIEGCATLKLSTSVNPIMYDVPCTYSYYSLCEKK